MTFYIIQALLLLVVAYFLGAWVGCTLRSVTSYRALQRETAFAGGGNISAVAADMTTERAVAPPSDISPPPPMVERSPPVIETKQEIPPGPAAKEDTAEVSDTQRAAIADDAALAKKRRQAIEAAALAAATAAAATITGEDTAKDASESAESDESPGSDEKIERAEPEKTEPTDAAKVSDEGMADNLLRIKDIDTDIAGRLEALGVARYAQIAEWTQADVTSFGGKLALSDRIGHENWIEQAKILAAGGVTVFAHNFDRGRIPEIVLVAETEEGTAGDKAAAEEDAETVGLTAVSEAAAEPVSAEAHSDVEDREETEETASATGAATSQDDLTRIRGINDKFADSLAGIGVQSFQNIADWTADDVKSVSADLSIVGVIERENWIEQASLLASGTTTYYASRQAGPQATE